MTPSSTVPGCGGNTVDIVPIYRLGLIITPQSATNRTLATRLIHSNRLLAVLATLHLSVQSISVCRSFVSSLS
jgi:hypothetical protein